METENSWSAVDGFFCSQLLAADFTDWQHLATVVQTAFAAVDLLRLLHPASKKITSRINNGFMFVSFSCKPIPLQALIGLMIVN